MSETTGEFNLGRPKLGFGSSHEKFDVWRRPKQTTITQPLVCNCNDFTHGVNSPFERQISFVVSRDFDDLCC